MSAAYDSLAPQVDITLSDGTHRRLLLEVDEQTGQAVEVSEQPDEGFPPPLAIGPPELNSDVRTRKVIWRDWRRGMGRDEYDETNGITDFRDSQCDTRFPNVLVCRPLPVRVGSNTLTVSASQPTRILYLGLGTKKWVAWNTTDLYTYDSGTNLWSAATIVNARDFVRAEGALFSVSGGYTDLSATTDGTTWVTLGTTGKPTSRDHYGLAYHDGKLFTLTIASPNRYTLYGSADAATAPASATWTTLGAFSAEPGEDIRQLYAWKFPPDPGRPGLFCLTSYRILYYDDTADAASATAWKTWFRWDQPYPTLSLGHALVWGRTGDKYVMPSVAQDKTWQFTGATIAPHGPNAGGGLPPARLGAIKHSDSNAHALVCWLRGTTVVGGTNAGMVVAFNDQEGWHHLLDTTNTAILGAGKSVAGGGLGPSSALTALSDGTVWEQEFFDTTALPQYATTARNYDSTALYHQTGKTDIGTPTLLKNALYAELNAAIPTGATVALAYRLDDSDLTGAWTALGTATATTAMPYRVGFPSGVTFRQAELQLTLTRGTAASATPIVRSLALHTTLVVPVRWVYQLRVDLRRTRAQHLPVTQGGFGRTNLRTWLRALHGQIVAFTVAHPADEIACTRAQVTVTPIEDPRGEGGRYLLQFRDLTTPTSGS